MSGEGSGSAPPTSAPPLSPLLNPAGVRYPLYAAVQGSPLLYSPAIFGQAMFPWRPLGTSLQTGTSTPSGIQAHPSSSSSHPTLVPNLTHLTQLPGLVYPLSMPMLQVGGASVTKATLQAQSEAVKRKNEASNAAMEGEAVKRPRLSESTPHSPSPSRIHTPVATPPSQRSPVIKFVPYNPGQSVVVSSATPPSTTLPQTVLIPTVGGGAQLQHQQDTQGGEASQTLQKPTYKLPHPSHAHTSPLASHLRIVLLKCFGPIGEGIISHFQLIASNVLLDLYRPSYFTTSNYSDPPLSPESCALLTICYLNSLRPGEMMSVENLRTMMHYAQVGEIEWLHYYKKHKKMSESTFVQGQLMHLARIAVYPVLGKVRVMISQQSLGEGVSMTLHHLAQMAGISKQGLPDFIVVLAIRPSANIDFCVLVLEPLQVQILAELQQHLVGVSRRKKGEVGGGPSQEKGSAQVFHIEQSLLSAMRNFRKKLSSNVLIPFFRPNSIPDLSGGHLMGNFHMPSAKAESLLPSVSHIVEHRPTGPFQDQYNVAMYMLQKINSCWGSQKKIEEFEKIDFRVLCPPEESLVSQTVSEIAASGLLDHLELRTGRSVLVHEEVSKRVLRCSSDRDGHQFSSFLQEMEANQKTLFIVIAENSHLTNSIAARSPGKHSPGKPYLSDNSKLLTCYQNCILLFVSSHPHSLQTNRSFVSYANEIHWPVRPPTNQISDEVSFFSAAHYQTSVADYGTSFREDRAFEDLLHDTCANMSTPPPSLVTLRYQLLLNQYSAALLSTLSHAPSPPPLPETQEIVNSLVFGPLTNPRGYGPMLVIRSHSEAAAKQFFQKLRAVRDSLGLRYRFEMIFDDGSEPIAVSDHFAKRIAQWRTGGGASCHGYIPTGYVMSYRELENLPCVVMLAGQMRAGLTFPSSLQWVDLRLCYAAHMTRVVYEYDISLLNGYRRASVQSPFRTVSGQREERGQERRKEAMATGAMATGTKDSSDCEVFENSRGEEEVEGGARGRPRPPRSSSSSSSRKSSYTEDVPDDESEHENRDKTVVEWRPNSKPEGEAGTRSEEGSTIGSTALTPSSDSHMPHTVTVTIDPPDEQMEYQPHSNSTRSHSQDPSPPFQRTDSVDETEDLFGDLGDSESESEGEEGDPTPAPRTCLLSRPYYHIWSSRSPHHPLLLPPAPGIDWHGGHKRPPLFDPDPHQQSAYYRKWTKPGDREVKAALDGVMKEASHGSRRRFLLTGPPQVGKTGAWLLLIQLIHDHLRSSQGVTVISEPTPPSVFLQETQNENSSSLSDNDRVVSVAAHTSSKHSTVVPLEYLKRTYQEMAVEEKERKPTITLLNSPKSVGNSPSLLPTNSIDPRHIITIPITPHVAYDFTHSCTECSKYLRGSPVGASEVLTFLLPAEKGGVVEIQWHVPTYQQKHCVISPDRKTLERLKLSTLRAKGEKNFNSLFTPIFTPTLGRESAGLFNLFHASFDHLHVLVTTASQFEKYCKAWPNHLVMALPEQDSMGLSLGCIHHLLKQFLQYNFSLNEAMVQYDAPSRVVWPMVLLMSDDCVMWRRIEGEGRTTDVSLSTLLSTIERSGECTQFSTIGFPQWNREIDEGAPLTLSPYDLNHNFILFNLKKLSTIQYNSFNYNSVDVNFNLQLSTSGLKACLRQDFTFVRKHLPSGGNCYPLRSQLCSDADKLVISLHHDSSSLLPHPGPYLMEHYLLQKSRVLFPYAQDPKYPVLVVDNYLNLGPSIHLTHVRSDMLQSGEVDADGINSISFGGLVLYLCEGRIAGRHLQQLNFLQGACLCLVTRDCKSLVREVARLDLEERWKFRLRDEYQTACPDHLKPLFFLTGRFES